MAKRFRQFRLLLWKNFILQIRRPFGTAFELLVPLAIVCVLIIPKLLYGDSDKGEYVSSKTTYQNCFSTFQPMFLSQNLKLDVFGRSISRNNMYLVFYPPGDPVASVMSKVSRTVAFSVTDKSVIHGKTFTSIDEVIAEVREHDDVYVGVVVFDIKEGQSELPKKVKYTIRLTTKSWERWNTDQTYPSWQRTGPRDYSQYTKKFIPIQYAVDMALIQEKTHILSIIPLNLQQFPYPDYTTYYFSIGIILMPLLFTLAFIYSAMSIIKEIVFEKQNRLKESMKMMGLANWVHWAAWYIKCLLFLMISLVLTTAILKAFKIFEHTNGFLLFLFFLLYAMSGISYCFFISVFFSSPFLGMLFGFVLWFAALVPGIILSTFNDKYNQLYWSAKAALCLLPNSALSIGVKLITRFEGLNVGITFDSINEPYTPEDTFTMAWVFGMMFISSVVFMVLTWYIEAIFPGKYGISKPFYFPFLKSYWCGYSHDTMVENNDGELHHSHDVEDEPADLEVGIAIKNLRKVFKGSTGAKVAVDGLSLKMFKGQITALLGHNGAGKTTTISILTGLFPPTSGSAVIGNKSILTEIDAIRDSLGLCPQHNVLFDRLTVREHLEFFVNLKGKYGQAANDEVMSMIKDMHLLDKTNAKSRTLSGGMKRKLSCAIALVGGSETVFLDEPTSGMDPYARRATWDLLLKYKAGKTIILTTHFMDEADFLGDRIAIMADGQLRCCGSSLFLKSRYGVGYHLTLVKKEGFNENIAINAIKRVVPSAEILSNVGAELELVLNRDAAKSFESLFLDLETKKEEYGIASFGVSVTTMEEVFIKVGEGSEKTIEDIAIDHHQHRDTDNIIEMSNNGEPIMGELLKGLPLKWQQYKAMLMKRFLNSKLLVPLFLILFGLLIANINFLSSNGKEPPRVLCLSNLSTDDSNVLAYYADFHQPEKDFKVARDFLKSIRVDAEDILDDVKAIHLGNMNNSIEVKGRKYTYTTPTKNKTTACCQYQFLILNKKCKSDFMSKSLTSDTCSKNKNFGYTKCKEQNCLLSNWCPDSLENTNLDDMNVYFSEYVLEKSNNKDYFKKHVAGFTFGHAHNIKNVHTSNNVTNTTKSVVVMPDTNSTVWYSNKGYHTIADALNAMSNILLRRHRVDDLIETTNYPIPPKKKASDEDGDEVGLQSYLAIFLTMGMGFMAASFIIFLVQERSSKTGACARQTAPCSLAQKARTESLGSGFSKHKPTDFKNYQPTWRSMGDQVPVAPADGQLQAAINPPQPPENAGAAQGPAENNHLQGIQQRIASLEALQNDSVEGVLKKIIRDVNSHETFSKDVALDHVLNLKVIAKEANHERASYYAAVFQAMKGKMEAPVDQFKRYLLVLVGDKDQEKVYEKMSKVDKSFDRNKAEVRGQFRTPRWSRDRVRCYRCQSFGHIARDCRVWPRSDGDNQLVKRRRTNKDAKK